MILPYNGITPNISNNVYIAPTAVVIGDVVLEDNVSVWFGAMIRGDLDRIVIGAGTNVQANCTLHEDRGNPFTIGKNVTIRFVTNGAQYERSRHLCWAGQGLYSHYGKRVGCRNYVLLNDVKTPSASERTAAM